MLRLNALLLIQAADISALLTTLEKFAPGSKKLFLEQRKNHLHSLLDDSEKTNPALAAALQATIDKHITHFPFDYLIAFSFQSSWRVARSRNESGGCAKSEGPVNKLYPYS